MREREWEKRERETEHAIWNKAVNLFTEDMIKYIRNSKESIKLLLGSINSNMSLPSHKMLDQYTKSNFYV